MQHKIKAILARFHEIEIKRRHLMDAVTLNELADVIAELEIVYQCDIRDERESHKPKARLINNWGFR